MTSPLLRRPSSRGSPPGTLAGAGIRSSACHASPATGPTISMLDVASDDLAPAVAEDHLGRAAERHDRCQRYRGDDAVRHVVHDRLRRSCRRPARRCDLSERTTVSPWRAPLYPPGPGSGCSSSEAPSWPSGRRSDLASGSWCRDAPASGPAARPAALGARSARRTGGRTARARCRQSAVRGAFLEDRQDGRTAATAGPSTCRSQARAAAAGPARLSARSAPSRSATVAPDQRQNRVAAGGAARPHLVALFAPPQPDRRTAARAPARQTLFDPVEPGRRRVGPTILQRAADARFTALGSSPSLAGHAHRSAFGVDLGDEAVGQARSIAVELLGRAALLGPRPAR